MASVPSDLGPVTGRVDRDGRLTEADPPLLRLQQEAGSKLGAPLALPQLAAVARSAIKLGVPLSRAVVAASQSQDLDLWVRVEPDERRGDHLTLRVDGDPVEVGAVGPGGHEPVVCSPVDRRGSELRPRGNVDGGALAHLVRLARLEVAQAVALDVGHPGE